MTVIGVLAVLALAFANGANDNAKPVSTLVGAGLVGARRALWFGTFATLAGSLLAIALGEALVASFSAKGIVGADASGDTGFLVSVTVGAAVTVLLATRLAFPISTTHALIGAIVGAGAVCAEVNFPMLGGAFVLPLLTSPLLAFVATAVVYPVAHHVRVSLGISRDSCLCIGTCVVTAPEIHACSSPAIGLTGTRLMESVGPHENCREPYSGAVLGLSVQRTATTIHWGSALAVAFARGLQDGAKITGIALLLGFAGQPYWVAASVAFTMAAGGLLAARRVEETMARRITRMNDGQALLANVLAAGIIFGATAFGAPVSTTHVSTGSLVGIRVHTDHPAESWLSRILLSWVYTLPVAALVAAAIAAVA